MLIAICLWGEVLQPGYKKNEAASKRQPRFIVL
jgi:hypothetical protein